MSALSASAGRFRPASAQDFSQYARNLAWLLQCPLQEAQELLAKGYGYASAHELRAVLAVPGTPGPFEPPTAWPLFNTYASPAHAYEPLGSSARLDWMVETAFDTRWRELIQQRSDWNALSRRELGCLEAGFFCSPKKHRQLFADVKAGCIALEGSPQKRRDWLEMHWPVGYWALLRNLYSYPPTISPSPGELASGGGGRTDMRVDPSCFRLCQFRAPDIYLLMTAGAQVPDSPNSPDLFEEARRNQVRLFSGSLGLYDHEWEWLDDELKELLVGHRIELNSLEREEVYECDEAFMRDGAKDPSLLHPKVRDVPDYASTLRSFRLRQLREMASVQGRSEFLPNATVVLSSRTYWPNRISAHAASNFRLMEDASPQRDEEPLLLDISIEMNQVSVSETGGCHMSLWRYQVSFSQVNERGQSAVAVGRADGWYIVPYDNNFQVHPDDFFECMDAASSQLNDVWKVLEGDFFPSQGLGSVNEFVDHGGWDEGDCIATLSIELEPQFRGEGLVPALINRVHDCFGEMPYSCIDYGWEAHARAAAGDELGARELDECDVGNPGITAFRAPGVFVLPILGEPPTDRIVRPHLRRSLHKTIKQNRDTPAEHTKRKLIRHFASMREDVVAHIVCYDPYEYPAT